MTPSRALACPLTRSRPTGLGGTAPAQGILGPGGGHRHDCGVRGHLIGGEEGPGAGSGAVEAGGSAWSRAVPEDLERALAALAPVRPAASLTALRRAGDSLASSAGEWLGLRLGLSAGEGVVLAAEAGSLRLPDPPRPDDHGSGPLSSAPVVLRANWRGLFGDLIAALGETYAQGRPCLILADSQVPELAQSLGEVLLDCRLAPTALAVLHGAGEDLDVHLEAMGLQAQPIVATRGGVLHVGPRHDPIAAARHTVQAAFNRVPGLAGQRGLGPRLVRCDPRVLSRFTEALLEELEALGVAARLAPIEPRGKRALERAVERALDVGATPIWGCDGAFEPCVLTNLDSGTVAPSPGLPLLLLSRAGRQV